VTAIATASSGSPSVLVDVLAYLPPTAPFAMTVLVGLGAVTWWQFLISTLISVLGTAGVAWGAAGIYGRAVLRTGRRVRVRELLPTRA
jgi:ABC-2 type transport system permease protein